MAAATAQQLRQAIATYLTAHVTGLRVITDGETLPSAPVAVIIPDAGKYIDYAQAMAPNYAMATYQFRCLVLISRGDVRAQTAALDGFLSPEGSTSIVAALAADPTVGGVADYVHPVEASWSGDVVWAGVEYMGGHILLEVAAQ